MYVYFPVANNMNMAVVPILEMSFVELRGKSKKEKEII
jgi:hypothetical protein